MVEEVITEAGTVSEEETEDNRPWFFQRAWTSTMDFIFPVRVVRRRVDNLEFVSVKHEKMLQTVEVRLGNLERQPTNASLALRLDSLEGRVQRAETTKSETKKPEEPTIVVSEP